MNAPKPTIQDLLLQDCNIRYIVTTAENLQNLAQLLKNKKDDYLDTVINVLKNTYNANVSVLYEEQTEIDNSQKKVFKALYFSTKEMRQAFASWSEIVFIDTTYKLLKRNLVVMIIAIRDVNKAAQIVGVSLLANEQETTLKAVLKLFIADNNKIDACKQFLCFITDKDLTE